MVEIRKSTPLEPLTPSCFVYASQRLKPSGPLTSTTAVRIPTLETEPERNNKRHVLCQSHHPAARTCSAMGCLASRLVHLLASQMTAGFRLMISGGVLNVPQIARVRRSPV